MLIKIPPYYSLLIVFAIYNCNVKDSDSNKYKVPNVIYKEYYNDCNIKVDSCLVNIISDFDLYSSSNLDSFVILEHINNKYSIHSFYTNSEFKIHYRTYKKNFAVNRDLKCSRIDIHILKDTTGNPKIFLRGRSKNDSLLHTPSHFPINLNKWHKMQQ